jgi:hypothetical protein
MHGPITAWLLDALAKREFQTVAVGRRSFGMTFIAVPLVVSAALGVGVSAGWRRGPLVGIVSGLGVLAAGALGYVALLALSLPM